MPIQDRRQLLQYLGEDLTAHGLERWRARYRVTQRVVYYQRLLRVCEYYETMPHRALPRCYVLVLKLRLRLLGERLGFDIPRRVFGPGLSIGHYGTISVNAAARVGRNCRLDAQTTIGDIRGAAPTIGDDVYIASGARVLGGVTVGDGAAVGANAVVLHDVPPGVTVAGVPARVVSDKGSRGVLGSPPLSPPQEAR
jgi:serine O-acetyltransferase